MKRLSKTLAVVLSLAMLISCIPGVVFTATATEATITQPQGVSIVENYDSFVGEEWVAQLGMPAKVTTSDGEADVQWADATKYVDLKTPGYYFVPGTVNGVAQAVYFPVQVRAYENVFPSGRNHDFESALQQSAAAVEDDPTTEENEATPAKYKPAYWALTDSRFDLTQTALVDSKLSSGGKALKLVKKTAHYEIMWANSQAYFVNVIKELGAGQYFFGFWAWSDVDSDSQFCVNLDVTYKNASGSTMNANGVSSGGWHSFKTEPQKAGGILSLDSLTEIKNETEYTLSSITFRIKQTSNNLVDGAMYFDNAEFVLLKTALTEVPPVITAVTSEIPAYSVIKNYDAYAGENWKEALALPAEVDVTLDNGGTGKASVEWDYSKLDLTTPGWYVLPGKVISDEYAMTEAMTVQQVIKVTEYGNLLENYAYLRDFEKIKTDGDYSLPEYWAVNKLNGAYPFNAAATKQVQSKVPNGGNAFMFTPTGYRSDIMYSSSSVRVLGKEIYALGAGQYHFSINAWSDNENGSEMYLELYTKYGAYTGTNNTNGASTTATTSGWAKILVDNRVTLTSDVQQPSMIASIGTTDASGSDIDYAYVNIRYTKKTDGAFYLDELCVLPLKIEMAEVPALVTEVTSTLTAMSVIKDYDAYAGADWQNVLPLPAQVDVKLNDNTIGKADVTWDFSTLDVSKLGRYVVTGTVSSEEYIITEELTVEQVIYIQEYSNIISTRNPDFDAVIPASGQVPGWAASYNQDPEKDIWFDLTQTSLVTSKVPNGGDATKFVMTKYRAEIMYNNGRSDMATAICNYGPGQYYFGAYAWTDAETTTTKFYLSVEAFYGNLSTNNGKISVSTLNDGYVYLTNEAQRADLIMNVDKTSNTVGEDTKNIGDVVFRLNTSAKGTFYLDSARVLPLVTYIPDLVEPTIKDASLALQNNLAIKYTAMADQFGDDFAAPYVVFTMNGKDTTVQGVKEGDRYVFWFKDIAPHQIADNITATLHATYGGVDVVVDAVDYSVLSYCEDMMGEGNTKLDTLLADKINYSVALQKALGKTPLDTSSMNLDAATKDDPILESKLNTSVAVVDGATAQFNAATLVIQDNITIRLFFKTEEDISGLKVKIGDDEITEIKSTGAENAYYVDYNGLNAAQMREVVNATVMKGDTAISNTIAYSVETYAATMQNSAIGDLVKAMMKYGDSAAAY